LLLKYYQLGQPQLERLVDADASQTLNTDLHLRLEFEAPLNLFRQLDPHSGAAYVLISSVDRGWLVSLGNRLGIDFRSADTQFRLAEALYHQLREPATADHLNRLGQGDRAVKYLENVLKADPENFEARRLWARVRLTQNRRDEAAKIFAELVRRRPDDAAAHASLADELLLQKKTHEAVDHYRDALRLEKNLSPDNGAAMWANNLAWVLATNPDAKIRNGAEAVEWARKACDSVDHKQPAMLDTLASALAENGQFDEAIQVSKQVLALAADNPALVKSTNERIKLFEASRPYHEK
jgi:tetratricopeptide (TPR) repeat protein